MVVRKRAASRAARQPGSRAHLDEVASPPPVSADPPAGASFDSTCAQTSAAAVPSVLHQIWLGGGTPRWLRLLSLLNARYVLRPTRHLLHYDVAPADTFEWQCACALATCVQARPRESVFDQRLADRAHVADLLRLDLLEAGGGMYADLDAYALRPFDAWRRCEQPLVASFGADERKLNNGVLLARAGAPFLGAWREAYRDYRPRDWDYNSCNVSTRLAAALGPGAIHLAKQLGPLPRYRTRAGYLRHLAGAPVAHLTGARHQWRYRDVQRYRLMARIAGVGLRAANASADEPSPLLRRCIAKIAGACWARGEC